MPQRANGWLLETWLLLSHPKGCSSIQMAAELGITQKSALRLRDRVRAMPPPMTCRRSVDHSCGVYVRGTVTTNGIESVWALLKRSYVGTHHWMSPAHLHRYITEHTWRYNHRQAPMLDRLTQAARQMAGRRLPWAALAGAVP